MRVQIMNEDRISLINEREDQSNTIAVSIRGVSKTFVSTRKIVQALHPVDLEVATGEFVCFLGPSGCGKSTLLSIVAGLEAASSGTVQANQKLVNGPGTDRILLFQEAALFPWLDVQRNVEFGLRQAGVSAKKRAALAG